MDHEEMTHDDEFWAMFRTFIDIVKPLRDKVPAFTYGAAQFLSMNAPLDTMTREEINQWAKAFNHFTGQEVERR